MIRSFFKKNYFFYGFLGSFCIHILFFVLSGIQNRRQFRENFVVQLPKKGQAERIYFTSVVLPQLKEKPPVKKETPKAHVSPSKTVILNSKEKNKAKIAPIKKEKESKKEKSKEVKKVIPPLKNPVKTIEKKVEQKKELKPIVKKTEPEVKKVKKISKTEKVLHESSMQNETSIEQETKEVSIVQPSVRDVTEQRKRELFFALAQAIKKEVALHWIPPMTDRKGLEARVKCTVSPKGKIEQVLLVESSQVIAYDMSVIRAAWKLATEKPLWGTQFLIAFNQ